jgi:hypothetical protein
LGPWTDSDFDEKPLVELLQALRTVALSYIFRASTPRVYQALGGSLVQLVIVSG